MLLGLAFERFALALDFGSGCCGRRLFAPAGLLGDELNEFAVHFRRQRGQFALGVGNKGLFVRHLHRQSSQALAAFGQIAPQSLGVLPGGTEFVERVGRGSNDHRRVSISGDAVGRGRTAHGDQQVGDRSAAAEDV